MKKGWMLLQYLALALAGITTVVGAIIWASPERQVGGIVGPGSYPVFLFGGLFGNGVVACFLLLFLKSDRGARWVWRGGNTLAVIAMIASLLSALGAEERLSSLSGRALQWPGTVVGLVLGWSRRQKPRDELKGQFLRKRSIALVRDLLSPLFVQVTTAAIAVFFLQSGASIVIVLGTCLAVFLFFLIRSLGRASPGERRVGLRVVHEETGRDATKLQRLFRAALLILWPLELIVLGFGSKRTLAERITNTRLSLQ
jgi:hypothetical protein